MKGMIIIMKRIVICILSLVLCFYMAACSAPTDSGGEGITDTVAKELFEKATNEIITLATEEPTTVIQTILGDVEVIYEENHIDGVAYYETTAKYKELHDYYSEIFTGDALDWILSTKFADVDGTLYCSPVGGASSWSITNLEVARTDQNDDKYIYEATFDAHEETTTSQFTIENTENGYRISGINYIPDLLKDK